MRTIEDERRQAVDYIYDDEATRKEKERRTINRKRIRRDTDRSDDSQTVSTSTIDEPMLRYSDTVLRNT